MGAAHAIERPLLPPGDRSRHTTEDTIPMKYQLLQVREARIGEIAFRAYSADRKVDLADYHETYAGEINGFLPVIRALEELFRRFNDEHPADFRSYSLSIADLVRIDGERFFYCDTSGWHPLEPDQMTGEIGA
jgi:hypothetical protein